MAVGLKYEGEEERMGEIGEMFASMEGQRGLEEKDQEEEINGEEWKESEPQDCVFNLSTARELVRVLNEPYNSKSVRLTYFHQSQMLSLGALHC